MHGELLQGRMPGERSAEQLPIPWPIALGAGCRMDSQEPAAVMDVILKRLSLLLVIERFVVAVREDNGAIILQLRIREHARIVRLHDIYILLRADFLNGFDAFGDVVVDVALFAVQRRSVVSVNEN